ncbi:traf3-interacting jnk-activating modulator, putative [Microscilla marina ATCC 23134]|uniref:Traf3-interacting jnk-activating modulator, putative n=2 Tax=Microscilla marina TaxID=1027 RepID=A1ZEE8_MICM2|nr:traf3-interacting jnk-activating modulator, putative [Microscilla marina ATCC 23134]
MFEPIKDTMIKKQKMTCLQQESKVKRIKTYYENQLRRSKIWTQAELIALKKQYESEIQKITQELELHAQELQTKLEYHQEMNDAQRVMLEDAIDYCKKLEEKLESITT